MRQAEPAKGLAQHIPLLQPHLLTQRFRVGDDVAGAKLGEHGVVDKRRRRRINPGRAARPALIQHDHLVAALERSFHPLEPLTRRRKTRATLQEQQRRGIRLTEDAGEDGKAATVQHNFTHTAIVGTGARVSTSNSYVRRNEHRIPANHRQCVPDGTRTKLPAC